MIFPPKQNKAENSVTKKNSISLIFELNNLVAALRASIRLQWCSFELYICGKHKVWKRQGYFCFNYLDRSSLYDRVVDLS